MQGFELMRYDISDLPKKKLVIDKFPELSEYSEFNDKKNDFLLRVAFLCTDEKSPFVKLEREDYERRIQKVFQFLEVTDDQLVSDLSLGRNKLYENMVNRYFMLCDNLAYVMWSNKLRMFHYIGVALREAPKGDNIVADMNKRASLDNQLKNIYNDLIEYEALVFTDIPTRNKLRKQISKLLQPAEQQAVEKQVI